MARTTAIVVAVVVGAIAAGCQSRLDQDPQPTQIASLEPQQKPPDADPPDAALTPRGIADKYAEAKAIVERAETEKQQLTDEIAGISERSNTTLAEGHLGSNLALEMKRRRLAEIGADPVVADARRVLAMVAQVADEARREVEPAAPPASVSIASSVSGPRIIDFRAMATDFLGPPDPIFENYELTAESETPSQPILEEPPPKVEPSVSEPLRRSVRNPKIDKRIEIEYDELRDYSAMSVDLGVVLNDPRREHRIEMSLVRTWSGKTRNALKGSPKIHMSIYSRSEEWKFLKYHDVSILADKTRIRPSFDSRDSDVDHGLTEWLYYDIELADVEAIGDADAVRMGVGITDFSLTPDQIAAVKRFTELLRMDSEAAEAELRGK